MTLIVVSSGVQVLPLIHLYIFVFRFKGRWWRWLRRLDNFSPYVNVKSWRLNPEFLIGGRSSTNTSGSQSGSSMINYDFTSGTSYWLSYLDNGRVSSTLPSSQRAPFQVEGSPVLTTPVLIRGASEDPFWLFASCKTISPRSRTAD